MRFKKGSKVKVMNKEARASWEDGQCIPIEKISGSYGDSKICHNDRVASFKKPKRASPFSSYLIEACPQKAKKPKAVHQEHVKVDAFAHFNNSLNGYYEMEKRLSELNDSDNDQCSVGSNSCSVLNDNLNNKLSSRYLVDITSSDTGSFNAEWDEEVALSIIHRLELNAYRSTLEALYASGPLSWEKEGLLTNLRISLHISNDEHLKELRHLISNGATNLN